MKDSEPARIYFRIMDHDDGTPEGACKVKMVANPPQSEWDPENLTSAQVLALHAMNAMLELHKACKEYTDTDPVVNAPAAEGNN